LWARPDTFTPRAPLGAPLSAELQTRGAQLTAAQMA